jgi:hypothetical protein
MRRNTALVMILMCGSTLPAMAGVYTDDLSRCLVESSTKEDRTALVQWIFAAISQNPSISALGKATDADIEKANAAVGSLFMRLLTETCVDKAKKAIKYEGAVAIQGAFEVLGKVASSDLFSDPKVQAVMAGLIKHVDSKKLEALKDGEP